MVTNSFLNPLQKIPLFFCKTLLLPASPAATEKKNLKNVTCVKLTSLEIILQNETSPYNVSSLVFLRAYIHSPFPPSIFSPSFITYRKNVEICEIIFCPTENSQFPKFQLFEFGYKN